MATTETKRAPHYAPTAGVLLLKIGKAAERRFEKALKPLGMTPRHLGVLFEVQACPTSQQALIDTIGVDASRSPRRWRRSSSPGSTPTSVPSCSSCSRRSPTRAASSKAASSGSSCSSETVERGSSYPPTMRERRDS